MYFEIYPSPAPGIFGPNPFAPPQWRWRLKSANHEILAQGESYVNRRDCEHAVGLLQQTSFMTPVRAAAA
jgi:uncharacterized protein YegP (UPF0339 family)